jgi:hypothetical protein
MAMEEKSRRNCGADEAQREIERKTRENVCAFLCVCFLCVFLVGV